MITQTIFRTYDIRGVVENELTPDAVFAIGQALGSLTREAGETHLIIGRDGRLSSPLLAERLSDGARSVGCHVIDIGMVPTPILYFATHHLPYRSGVMVTGSHNPPNYNGLKMVIAGQTLSGDAITALYERILAKNYTEGHGTYQALEVQAAYLQAVTQRAASAKPLKIVIDAGNGVTGAIAPALFTRLGHEVIPLFCEIDGQFPNHHPDPSDTHNLQDLILAVKTHQADIGLAFDGDGDRLGVVTSRGDIIWPDRLLMLFAQSILASEHNAKIIYDVKCTHALAPFIKQFGGEPIMWKTGHSLIKAKLAETAAALAGEMSGHFFFKHHWYGFDDALYAGARLLAVLSQQEKSSAEVFDTIPNSVNTPELKVPVADCEKFALMEALTAAASFDDADIITIDGVRVNFAEGWGLVRPSNTTPCLVLRFEANDARFLHTLQQRFREWMLSVNPALALPF